MCSSSKIRSYVNNLASHRERMPKVVSDRPLSKKASARKGYTRDRFLLEYRRRMNVLFNKLLPVEGIDKEISNPAYFDSVFRKLRGLLYGSLYNEDGAGEMDIVSKGQTERTEIFATFESIEELKDFILKMKRVLLAVTLSNGISTYGKFFASSVSEEYRLCVLNAMESQNWDEVESLIMPIAVALPDKAVVSRAVLFSAALLLSLVYLYLRGLVVDKGGTKTYSSGSLEFRSTYISIVLFQGAYVWIKFRDVAPSSLDRLPRLHRKSRLNASGQREYYGKYEPRFRLTGTGGRYVYVGQYEHAGDAEIMYDIVAFYYGKGDGKLVTFWGDAYDIPPMTEEEHQNFSGDAKVEFVKRKAKEVYNSYKLELNRVLSPSPRAVRDHPPEFPVLHDVSPTSEVQVEGDSILGNQADALEFTDPNNCSPNGGPDTQAMLQIDAHGAVPSSLPELSERLLPQTATNARADAAAVPSGQRQPQEHPGNHSASNVISDDLSSLRQLRESQRQLELRDSQIAELRRQQQLEVMRKDHQISELQLQDQQKDSRLMELQRLHQRELDQISRLQGEIESLRSTENVCKRPCCYGTHS